MEDYLLVCCRAANLLEMLQKSEHQQQSGGERVVRQLEDGIKRSLGLGEAAGGGQHHQQLSGSHHHNYLPPGLHLGAAAAHHQFPGGILGFPPHHLQQQQSALRPQHRQQQQQQSQDSDMSAFKKLVRTNQLKDRQKGTVLWGKL